MYLLIKCNINIIGCGLNISFINTTLHFLKVSKNKIYLESRQVFLSTSYFHLIPLLDPNVVNNIGPLALFHPSKTARVGNASLASLDARGGAVTGGLRGRRLLFHGATLPPMGQNAKRFVFLRESNMTIVGSIQSELVTVSKYRHVQSVSFIGGQFFNVL